MREKLWDISNIVFHPILLEICPDFKYVQKRERMNNAFNLLNRKYLGRNMLVQCILFGFLKYS